MESYVCNSVRENVKKHASEWMCKSLCTVALQEQAQKCVLLLLHYLRTAVLL